MAAVSAPLRAAVAAQAIVMAPDVAVAAAAAAAVPEAGSDQKLAPKPVAAADAPQTSEPPPASSEPPPPGDADPSTPVIDSSWIENHTNPQEADAEAVDPLADIEVSLEKYTRNPPVYVAS